MPPEPKPCNKLGYPNQEAAERALGRAWRTRRRCRVETRAYRCPKHKREVWHLTSQALKHPPREEGRAS